MERFIRPEMQLLPEEALIPGKNLVDPPPDQFSHEMARAGDFYFSSAAQASKPNGSFPAKTKLLLIRHDGGRYCRVADGRGIYAEIEFAALRKL